MSIAFEDSGFALESGGQIVVSPSGGAAASGEVIQLWVYWEGSAVSSFPSSLSSTGFTDVTSVSGNFGRLYLLRKVAGGSEPSSYTVTWSGGSFYNAMAAVLVYSGVDNTTPFGTASQAADDADGDATFEFGAITIGTANSWDVVGVASVGDADPGTAGGKLSSWSNSLVERFDQFDDFAGFGVATALRTGTGTTGTGTVTSAFASNAMWIRVEMFEGAGANATANPTGVAGTGSAGSVLALASPSPPYTLTTITG